MTNKYADLVEKAVVGWIKANMDEFMDMYEDMYAPAQSEVSK